MTKAQAFLAALIERTKADAAVHGSSICHAQWEDGATIRCHVVHGRAYLSTMDGGRVSRAMLQDKLDSTPPASAREQADEAFAVAMAASLDGPVLARERIDVLHDALRDAFSRSSNDDADFDYWVSSIAKIHGDAQALEYLALSASEKVAPFATGEILSTAGDMRAVIDNRRIEPPAVERVYYIVKTGENRFDLRQTRFKAQLAEGREHPHDLCAVGFDATGMRQLVDSGFDADVAPLNSSDNRRIDPPANYPTVLDVLHHHAEDIQDRLFVHPKGSSTYICLCDALAHVHRVFESHEREVTLGQKAADYLDSAWTESVPAWPATETELDARLAAQTARIDSDLEYASYYAKRARFCSIDAVMAHKVGRDDIAEQLRSMRDLYAQKARHLYRSVVYGNLFQPFGGV